MFSFFKKKHTEVSKPNKSIYQYIHENIGDDGKLPIAFSLPDDRDDNQIKFAAGAMDGMGIYHMGGCDSSETVEKLIPLFESALSNPDRKSEQNIKEFLSENRVLRLIDPLSDKLRSGQTNIKPQNLLATAFRWATESDDIEFTKFGLALLGLLNIENDEKYRNVILTLGKCDEFTLYSLVAISGWADCRELIFKFAKTTHGWGKIHSVERLTPETQEEKDWILKYGCENGVVNSYLSLVCAEKGDMLTTLKRTELDKDLFWGISIIIEALFDEGPTAGISAYQHADEAMHLYLKHAETLCDSTAILSTILSIKEHYEKIDPKEATGIVARCDKIIERDGWDKIAVNEINSGDKIKFYSAWSTANKLGFDIDDALFGYIEQNPLDNGYYISTLLKNPNYRDKIMTLYENVLPLERIASGMGDRMGLGKEYEPHRCLALGIRFIQTGLASPVINNRNGACAVLEAWKSNTNQTISAISTDIATQLNGLHVEEFDENLRERYKKLMDIC